MLPEIIKGFIILACIFIPLERIFSLHKQKIFRLGWKTDATYFFTGHFIGRSGAIVVAVTLSLMTDFFNPELQSKIASQPIWLQFVEAVIVSDMAYYIAQRLLHEVPWLWQFSCSPSQHRTHGLVSSSAGASLRATLYSDLQNYASLLVGIY